MIKELDRAFTYFESEERFDIEINGKAVVAFRYEKNDPRFSDYEITLEIKNEEDFTEEEQEEIREYIDEQN